MAPNASPTQLSFLGSCEHKCSLRTALSTLPPLLEPSRLPLQLFFFTFRRTQTLLCTDPLFSLPQTSWAGPLLASEAFFPPVFFPLCSIDGGDTIFQLVGRRANGAYKNHFSIPIPTLGGCDDTFLTFREDPPPPSSFRCGLAFFFRRLLCVVALFPES